MYSDSCVHIGVNSSLELTWRTLLGY